MPAIVKLGKKAKAIAKTALAGKEKHYVSYVRRLERVKTDERVCAMTFDDGPMADPAAPDDGSGRGMTEILLDVMKKYGAHGTFDVVGFTGDNYPDEAGKVGTPLWGGTRFDHYPDFGRDTYGGALHQMELVKRMLREGHSLSNHGYRHIIFGKKPFVYGKRSSLGDIDKVLADQKALHDLILKETGCTVTMGRPPHYVDRIDKNLTSYDAYALMGYQYMAASYDGGGWLPSGESDEKKATQAEIDAMISVIRKKLDADPDFFRGQIIFQKDGYNMAKRTPVAYALEEQLRLLTEAGYRVVSVEELLEISPFADVGSDCPLFAKLKDLAKDHAIAYDDNTLRLDAVMTWGELAMLLAPKDVVTKERIETIRQTGKQLTPYRAALAYCEKAGLIPAGSREDGAVTAVPDDFFDPLSGFRRYDVLAAYRKQ